MVYDDLWPSWHYLKDFFLNVLFCLRSFCVWRVGGIHLPTSQFYGLGVYPRITIWTVKLMINHWILWGACFQAKPYRLIMRIDLEFPHHLTIDRKAMSTSLDWNGFTSLTNLGWSKGTPFSYLRNSNSLPVWPRPCTQLVGAAGESWTTSICFHVIQFNLL